MTHSFNFTAQEVRLVLHSFQTVKQLHPGMRIRSNQRSFIYAWEISQLCENILDFSSDSHSHCGFFHRISLSFQVVPKFMYTNLHMTANFLDRNNQTILMFATNKALGKRPSHCLLGKQVWLYWKDRQYDLLKSKITYLTNDAVAELDCCVLFSHRSWISVSLLLVNP